MNKVYYFQILLGVVCLIIIFIMPKRMTKQEIYVTWIGLLGVNIFVDIILNGFEMIEYVAEGLQPMVTFLRAVTYPALGVIYLNYMPKRNDRFVTYFGIWFALFLVIEVINTTTKYLIYKNWSLFYSAISYIVLLLGLRWHINFLRKERKFNNCQSKL